jgi:hypothetical protein
MRIVSSIELLEHFCQALGISKILGRTRSHGMIVDLQSAGLRFIHRSRRPIMCHKVQ